jgi:hypothetical protein
MIVALTQDLAWNPRLFVRHARIQRGDICAWLAETKYSASPELVDIWLTLGVGDLFETESILGPRCGGGFDVDERTSWLRSRGLPNDEWAFHIGSWVSSVEEDGETLIFRDGQRLRKMASSMSVASWYEHLRAEFASRYGLP